MAKNFGIAIHGGAGTIRPQEMSSVKEKQYKEALEEAIQAGYDILHHQGTAMDAIEKAVCILEDCPLFNAGRGSVFTSDERHEMDASIMDGKTLEAGAVSLVKTVKNPIKLARVVMEKSGHVFLAAEGAEAFAKEMGFEQMDQDYFYTDFRYNQLKLAQASNQVILDHSSDIEKKFGTVGAVALDQYKNLAAATSTGGMTNKKYGRIGDTPLIGAGTYADNRTVAISCTGSGEYFIRNNTAFHIHSMMLYGKKNLADSAYHVVQEELKSIGGDGGIIAIDHLANIHFEFNTEGMYRAARSSESNLFIGIYK